MLIFAYSFYCARQTLPPHQQQEERQGQEVPLGQPVGPPEPPAAPQEGPAIPHHTYGKRWVVANGPWRVKQSNPSPRKGKKRKQTTRQWEKEHQAVTSIEASDPCSFSGDQSGEDSSTRKSHGCTFVSIRNNLPGYQVKEGMSSPCVKFDQGFI